MRLATANNETIESVWKAANPLEGHSTQLKPAHEPICVARKTPKYDGLATHFDGGIAGMNIGDSRIPYEDGEKVIGGGHATSFFTIADGLITQAQEFFADATDPPFGRSQWTEPLD